MRKNVTKRIVAIVLCFCFVLSQMNLPSGLIKLDFSKLVINTKAATDLQEDIDIFSVSEGTLGTAIQSVTFNFRVIEGNKVALVGATSTAFEDSKKHYAIEIPETIKDGKYVVTSIGSVDPDGSVADGLKSLGYLEYVSIPKSVTTIADGAFQGDGLLHIVEFAPGSQLEYIGNNAFAPGDADKPAKADLIMHLPATVKYIGSSAFYQNACLQGIVIDGDASSELVIKDLAFSESQIEFAHLPDGTKSIGEGCFKDCKKLKGCNIPANLENIPDEFLSGAALWTTDTFDYKLALGEAEETNTEAETTTTPKKVEYVSNTITFSDKLKTIGTAAFKGTKVTGVDFKKATLLQDIPKQAFQNCGSLITVNLLNGTIHTLSDEAFRGCAKIGEGIEGNSIVFPQTLKNIGASCFSGDTCITSLEWNNAMVETIGASAFAGIMVATLYFPTSVTKLPDSVCEGCAKLGRVMIPAGVTEIGKNAFSACGRLSELQYFAVDADHAVSKPNGQVETGSNGYEVESKLSRIGADAFNGASLSAFYMPKELTTLETGVFYGCTMTGVVDSVTGKRQSVFFNDVITTIEDGAFTSCSGMTDIVIPDTVTSMGTSVFFGCKALQNVEIQSKTLNADVGGELPSDTFAECGKLKTVKLASGVKKLGANAFSKCSALEYIDMAAYSELAAIGGSCFMECANFAAFQKSDYDNAEKAGKLVFPATLETIGGSAFRGCKKITSVDLSATTVSQVPTNAFYDASITSAVFSPKTTTIAAGSFYGCDITYLEFSNATINSNLPSNHITKTTFRSLNSDGQTYTNYISTSTVKIKVPANLIESYKTYFRQTLGFSTLADSQFISGVEKETTTLTMNVDKKSIGVGATFTLTAKQDVGSAETVEFTSSNPAVASVTQAGVVKAIRTGETVITAKTNKSGTTATCTITVVASSTTAANIVKNPITEITFSATQIGTGEDEDEKLFPGDTRTVLFGAKTSPTKDGVEKDPDAYEDELTLSITNVDASGVIYGKKNADGTITANNGYVNVVCDPVNKQCKVTVLKSTAKKIVVNCSSSSTSESFNVITKQALASIAVKDENVAKAGKELAFVEKNTYNVKALFACEPAKYDEKLLFETSNPNVATVDANGVLTHVGYGSTVITAYGEKSTNVRAQVTISLTLKSLVVEKTTFTLYAKGVNKSAQINLKTILPAGTPVTYESTNPKCVTVSATGAVAAKAAGEATIKVTALGKTAEVSVNVPKSVITVTVPGASLKKKVYNISKKKKKSQLSFSATYVSRDRKPTVKYKSSKKSVATISKKGLIKLKKKGKTKITVTVDGYAKTFTLNVTK